MGTPSWWSPPQPLPASDRFTPCRGRQLRRRKPVNSSAESRPARASVPSALRRAAKSTPSNWPDPSRLPAFQITIQSGFVWVVLMSAMPEQWVSGDQKCLLVAESTQICDVNRRPVKPV
jgi:hypothetical protein